jgi:hypothetical protein
MDTNTTSAAASAGTPVPWRTGAGVPVPAGNPGEWGRMGPHAPGRTGPHGAARPHRAAWGLVWVWGPSNNNNKKPARGSKKKKARGRLLFAALACWRLGPTTTNNPLALPSKHTTPADLFMEWAPSRGAGVASKGQLGN